jgi:formylglycine-generating enzyme required for sulfatase activity
MLDIPRETLIQIVSRFGIDVSDDPKRCEALLRDLCGSHKREIVILVAAIREGVTADLRQSQGSIPQRVLIERFSQRLHDNLGVVPDLARWSVESWAIALETIHPIKTITGAFGGTLKDSVSRRSSSEPSPRRCPSCKAINKAYYEFCSNCREPLLSECFKCGQKTPLLERFCFECRDKQSETSFITHQQGEASALADSCGLVISYLNKNSSILINSVGIKFQLISSGKFLMGSTNTTEEKPIHQVKIIQPFYMGIHEVTQAQYEQVTGMNPSKFKGSLNPVEQVSWVDAVNFCRMLSNLPAEKAAGRTYRLPAEAEWEYSCRAGTTTEYSFGNNDSGLELYAWFESNSGCKTHPVGQKRPNAWGLYDMHSNVWEWCSDWYKPYRLDKLLYQQRIVNVFHRVVRSGGWSNHASNCRVASRSGFDPSDRDYDLGFRLVMCKR